MNEALFFNYVTRSTYFKAELIIFKPATMSPNGEITLQSAMWGVYTIFDLGDWHVLRVGSWWKVEKMEDDWWWEIAWWLDIGSEKMWWLDITCKYLWRLVTTNVLVIGYWDVNCGDNNFCVNFGSHSFDFSYKNIKEHINMHEKLIFNNYWRYYAINNK